MLTRKRASVRPSVPVSVIRADFGETREPIEFILGRYLRWSTATPTPKGYPSSTRGGVMGPKFWVLWEGIGQL